MITVNFSPEGLERLKQHLEKGKEDRGGFIRRVVLERLGAMEA